MRVVHLGNGNESCAVKVKMGETFEFHLDENPSTGYGWELDIALEGVLDPLRNEFLPGAFHAVGRTGHREISLRAKAIGITDVYFSLRRAWSPEQPRRQIRVGVEVTG